MNTCYDPRDQDAKAELAERKAARDLEWLRGEVGEASYLAGLKCLGYMPQAARAELYYLQYCQSILPKQKVSHHD